MRCLILVAALLVVCATAAENDDVILNLKVLGGKFFKHIRRKPQTLAPSNNTNIAVLMAKISNQLEKQERKQTNEINKLTNTLSSLIEDLKKNLSSHISALIENKKDKNPSVGSNNCKIKNACGRCHCQADKSLKKQYFCDCRHVPPKRDCLDYLHSGYKTNGVYKIHEIIDVYCDQKTDGGGWIVIQRRVDDSVSFYRNWQNYKTGFGRLQSNFWLGNDNIHALTQLHASEIRFELEYWDGTRKYAKYRNFQVGDEASKYKLQIGSYSGNAGDSMAYHNGKAFSTIDRDNDGLSSFNCAKSYKGGWWYHGGCHHVNLNGRYYKANEKFAYASGIHWYKIDKYKKSMKFAEMKIRRNQ